MLSIEVPPGRRASVEAPIGGQIVAVEPGSPAAAAGAQPGDRLLTINGRAVVDEIDVRFHQDAARVRLTVDRNGVEHTLTIRKAPDTPLGITFADGLFDGVRECNNHCAFCFLKGLPSGLRRSLYFKDDDYRLSFLYGNFVTLTNLSQRDWDRIVEERLSPLYVSVHATDPALRRHLLGNPSAPAIIPQLRWLAQHGIQTHTQLVVLPGVNDGAALRQSIEELAELAPAVLSIGVVPVGMSERGAFSQQIRPELARRLAEKGLRPSLVSDVGARAVIDLVRPYQKAFRKRFGKDLVYLADEYYLRAGAPIPPRWRYDGYPQYQNGIGMARDLLEQFAGLRRRPPTLDRPVRITAVCGELVYPLLAGLIARLPAIVPNLRVDLVPVHNTFFGSTVTASGLLTTRDIVRTVATVDLGEALAIPRAMLDSTGSRFLDDGTPDDLATALGVRVGAVGTLRELIRFASGR
ncbi:MAG: DUF512 domain-containing protein [Dehalococcoidia bacterium]|nr:DUF512 domain-containing protein [Dehalococcoidia bacterium]